MADSRILLANDLIIDQNQPPVHRTRYSEIYSGICFATKVLIQVPSQRLQWNNDDISAFRFELERRTNLPHPNLCLLLGACIEPNIAIVLEFTEGSITELVSKDNIPLFKKLSWAKEAAQALSWLHGASDPVIIEDLKLSNLYYDAGGKIKVHAWNPFEILPDSDNLPVEYLINRAPELILRKERTTACDVYSFGILLYQLITNRNVYTEFKTSKEFINAVCNHHQRPIIPNDCDNDLQNLIQSCWHPDPKQRPCFTTISDQLDKILIPKLENKYYRTRIYSSIDDTNARNFWELFFLHEIEITWNAFSEVFFPINNDYASLPPRITNNNRNNITIDMLPNFPSQEQLDNATKEQLQELAARSRTGRAIVAKEIQARQNSGYTIQTVVSEEEMIKELLCTGDNQLVTLVNFGSLIGWFAPLNDTFINRVKQVITNPYFHGKLSFNQTNGILQANMSPNNRPCLLRFSGNKKNTYCICYVVVDPNKGPSIKHLPVLYKSREGFKFQGKMYITINELMVAAQKELHFTSNCGDTPYIRFYEDQYYI